MGKELVSIIIPVFNTRGYLEKCISSALEQSYTHLEIIAINDGSTDGSGTILDNFEELDGRVRVVHQNNKGVSAARNQGLDIARGKYCCFLDSDDWLEHDTIEYLMSLGKNQDRIASCDRYFVNYLKDEVSVIRQREEDYVIDVDSKKALLETGTGSLNLQSACYKLFPVRIIKENKIRFNESIYHGEDGLFVFEVLHYADGLVFSSSPKWYIVSRPDSATSSEYNSRFLTAMYAVDIMLQKSTDYPELVSRLKLYFINRSVIVKLIYSIGSIRNKDRRIIDKNLRRYFWFYLRSSEPKKEKLKYLFVLLMPSYVIKIVTSILKARTNPI